MPLCRRSTRAAARACASLLAGIVILTGAAPADADVVRLKNGGILEGQVTETATDVRVVMPYGEMVVPRSQVAAIERARSPQEFYAERARKLAPDDVAGRWELARWCLDQGLRDAASEQLLGLLRLQPDHQEARRELDRLEGRALPAGGPAWIEVRSPHFILKGPGRRADLEALAGPLEAAVVAFAAELEPALELRPLSGQYPVQVYTDGAAFRAYMQRAYPDLPFLSETGRGMMRGFCDLAREELLGVIEPDAVGKTPETLVHEVTHLLAWKRLALPRHLEAASASELQLEVAAAEARAQRKAGTIWIDEGLANFFGGSTYADGRLFAGVLPPGGETAESLARLQTLVAGGKAPSLNSVVAGDAEDFGGAQADTWYAVAWSLVHFLLRGAEGRYRAPFLLAVEEYRTGIGGLAPFRRALACDPDEIAGAWKAYVLALRPGR